MHVRVEILSSLTKFLCALVYLRIGSYVLAWRGKSELPEYGYLGFYAECSRFQICD